MKKIFLMMAAVVAFAAVSCESDNLNPDPDKKFVKELTVNIDVDGTVVMGKAADTLGHLEGFSGVSSSYSWDNITTRQHAPFTKVVEWVVAAKEGTEVTVTVSGPKAGSVKATVVL